MTEKSASAAAAIAAVERKTKILRITLGGTVASFIIFLIMLTSSKWITITYPSNFYSNRQKLYVVRSTYGIIWECLLGKTTNKSSLGKQKKKQAASVLINTFVLIKRNYPDGDRYYR